jgi:hypothetical protein
MLISHEHRAIYIHPPKTGGYTLRSALSSRFGFKPIPEYPAADWHCWKIPSGYEGFRAFGTVRNPYARWVSWYAHTMATTVDHPVRKIVEPILDDWGKCTFAAFTEYLLSGSVKNDLLPCAVMLARDVVILRQENLAEDFAKLWFTDGRAELPFINSHRHPPWQECYTPATKQLVERYYEKDFDAYGYPRDFAFDGAADEGEEPSPRRSTISRWWRRSF